MVRQVFDLLLGQVTCVERVERLAVFAHALGAVAAHLRIELSRDLAVELVEPIVQGRLLYNLPWVLYPVACHRESWRIYRKVFCWEDRLSVKALGR